MTHAQNLGIGVLFQSSYTAFDRVSERRRVLPSHPVAPKSFRFLFAFIFIVTVFMDHPLNLLSRQSGSLLDTYALHLATTTFVGLIYRFIAARFPSLDEINSANRLFGFRNFPNHLCSILERFFIHAS
jgi:4-hydroxybenzoate polyprenyltransferase